MKQTNARAGRSRRATPAVRDEIAAAQAAALPRQLPGSAAATARAPAPAAPPPPSAPKPSLAHELANLAPFSALAPSRLHALVVAARPIELPAGDMLFQQGDASRGLYVVVDGAVVPIAEGEARRKLAVLERGALVGEIGLVTWQPRNASVEALVDSQLVELDRGALFPIFRSDPEFARAILAPVRSRMLDRQLRTHRFFAAFAPGQRIPVARQFRIVEVDRGRTVVKQGEPPQGLHLVLAGALTARDARTGQVLRPIGIGDLFGGTPLLAARPAPAEIVAREKAWLLLLGEHRFRRLIEANPRLVRVLERSSVEGALAAGREPESGRIRRPAERSTA